MAENQRELLGLDSETSTRISGDLNTETLAYWLDDFGYLYRLKQLPPKYNTSEYRSARGNYHAFTSDFNAFITGRLGMLEELLIAVGQDGAIKEIIERANEDINQKDVRTRVYRHSGIKKIGPRYFNSSLNQD